MVKRVWRDGAKNLGELRDGVLTHYVKESAHLYRKLDAWAINYDMWAAWAGKVSTVRVIDTEQGLCYTVSAETFDDWSMLLEHEDAQWALPRSFWGVEPLEEEHGNSNSPI